MLEKPVAWNSGWAGRLGREILYFSGLPRLFERSLGGLGVILKFERVRPRSQTSFQPLLAREITPEFLQRMLRAFRRWKFDIVSPDEIAERVGSLSRSRQRFVSLTFEGGYSDFLEFGAPILARSNAPYTLYIPSGFPDAHGDLWWLALEQVIAEQERIGLILAGVERRFVCSKLSEKSELFSFLYDQFRLLGNAERNTVIRDLCGRYGVDLYKTSRIATMTWSQIGGLAANPLATIASASLGYPMLSRLTASESEREMKMGRAVLESAIGRPAQHFAYPFGDHMAYGVREIQTAAELGFMTAVSAEPGVVRAGGKDRLWSLPRVAWDGRCQSLRVLRVVLTGFVI